MRLLGKLATAVVASGDPVWYTGDTRDLPPQVEDAVQEYVDEAHSKTVAVLPLRRPAPPEEDDPKKRVEPEAPIGALIVEQIEDSRVAASLMQRSDVVCQHSSTALANALEHQNLFLMPVWRALGKTRWVVARPARCRRRSASPAACCCCCWSWGSGRRDFTLESKGTLEPVRAAGRLRRHRRRGRRIPDGNRPRRHGRPRANCCCSSAAPKSKWRSTEVQGKRLATNEQLSSVQRELARDRALKPEERNRLAGQQAELKQKLVTLERPMEAVQGEAEAELEVRSPIDGEIVTWDLRNRLLDRPVQRGQVLLRVADPDGPWQLELHMPENRMGHITKYAASHADDPLDVSYILATEPGTTHHGKVKEIHSSAEVRGDEGNTVLIKVDSTRPRWNNCEQQQKLRPGRRP